MLEFIRTYFFTLIESILLYCMLNSLLTCKFTGYKKRLFFISAILIDSLLVQFCNPISFTIKPLLFMIISLVISSMLYKDNIFIKIFFILLNNYIFVISDIISGNFSSILYRINIDKILSYTSNFNVYFFIFSKVISFFLIIAYIMFFKKINLDISPKYWIIIDSIIGIFIIIINFFMGINNILQKENLHYSNQIFKISVCFLLMTILTIYMFGKICYLYQQEQKRYALNLKDKMLEQQLTYQEVMAENMKKIRHDINNNLINISYLLKENHINESLEYINAIASTLETTKSVINCGNKYIDAILNYEISICKKNKIKIEFNIDNIPDLQILPTDLSSMISNILNNAIEANINIPTPNRYIISKMFCYKNYLSIIVKNPYEKLSIKSNRELRTIKKDILHHGYGLKLVKSSAEKYGGTFKYTYGGNVFTSIIMLPINLKDS